MIALRENQVISNEVKVSIGLPVYNGSTGLADALESLINQTVRDIEIVISDNASTDTTPDICRRYATQDDRIIYLRQRATIPPIDNFMFVLTKARAPWFLWAAHDDVRSPYYIEKLLATLQANPNAVLAFGDNIDVRREGETPVRLNLAAPGAPRWRRLEALAFSQLYPVYGLWRTDRLRRLEWFYNDWWADLPFMMAASMLGDFVHVPGVEFKYRTKGNARYFDLPLRPGVRGLLTNLRTRIRRACHMARAPFISAVSVSRVAGLLLGLYAGFLTAMKVGYLAAGYFWHWLRVQLGMLPKPCT